MIIIVTGGIGSGKTYVTQIFTKLGIPVFNTDQIAKDLIVHDQNIYQKIQRYFNVYDIKNNFRKIKLQIFKYKKKRLFLENILHPKMLAKIVNINTDCIIEIPLVKKIFYMLKHIKFDKLIFIDCNHNIQISRVMHRDKLSKSTVDLIINSQLGLSKNINKIQQIADYILDGNSLNELHIQAMKVCLLLKNMLKNTLVNAKENTTDYLKRTD